MKVRLLVGRAGPVIGVQNVDDVVEVDEAEARRLVAAGHAEVVKETASVKPVVRKAVK